MLGQGRRPTAGLLQACSRSPRPPTCPHITLLDLRGQQQAYCKPTARLLTPLHKSKQEVVTPRTIRAHESMLPRVPTLKTLKATRDTLLEFKECLVVPLSVSQGVAGVSGWVLVVFE